MMHAFADSFPAYNALLVIHSVGYMAQRGAGPADPVVWDVYRSDGVLLGSLAVPATLRVTYASPSELVGVETDEEGVEYIVVYEWNLKVA
jgi:hypothetical protein